MNLDLSWLGSFANSPVELVILGCFLLLALFFWKVLPLQLAKNDKGIISRLDEQKVSIDTLVENDKRQDRQLNDMQIDAWKKIIYNENLPFIERVFAAHKYLNTGNNSSTAEYVKKEIMARDVQTWDEVERQLRTIKERP
jgi:hypothetical protein